MKGNDNMIELKDICIEYDRVILDHASISIPQVRQLFSIVLRLWIQKASINTIMIIIS